MQRLMWLKVLLVCFGLKGTAAGLYAASDPTAAPNDVISKGEFRTWQTNDGRTARLAFTGLSNDHVQFRMVDGRIAAVPLARLCQADREWIANYGSRSATSVAPAAPPEARGQFAFRTWQDVEGRTATLAFAGLTGDRVLFRMTDGRMAAVAPERLSPSDREWLAANGVQQAERGFGTQPTRSGIESPPLPTTESVVGSGAPRGATAFVPVRLVSFQQPVAADAPSDVQVELTTLAWQNAAKPILARKSQQFVAAVRRSDETADAWQDRLLSGIAYAQDSQTVTWTVELAPGVALTEETRKVFEDFLKHDVPEALKIGTQQFEQLKFVVELRVVPLPKIPKPQVPTPQPSVSKPQAPANEQSTGPGAKCACVEGISRRPQTGFRCCQVLTHRCRCFLARLRYVLFARRCRH